MKKILFIATAAAMIAGCAKVTTVDTGEPQEIAFEAYYYGTTKAPLDNSAEFPTDWNMLVHALYDGDADNLHYFGEGGTSFTYDGSSVWHDATTTRYWPATGTLTFNAVAPTATIGGVTSFTDVTFNYGSGYDLSNITATLGDNSSNQTDVLVAKTAKSGKIQGDLPMTFKHALAQVVFKAATADESQTITIKNAVLKGSFQEGSITATPSESDVTFAWNTEGKTAKDMNVCESANQQLTTAATEVGNPVLVVPIAALDDTQLLELTYDITYPDGEASMTDVVATVALKVDGEAQATSWDAGKKYIYTLTFSGPREITIDPDVEDWVDQEVEVPGL